MMLVPTTLNDYNEIYQPPEHFLLMSETNDKLRQLMADLFKCPLSDLADETGPGDIAGWDSLGHVSLMAEIQKHFGTHVPVEDAIEVESIKDLVEILDRLEGTSA